MQHCGLSSCFQKSPSGASSVSLRAARSCYTSSRTRLTKDRSCRRMYFSRVYSGGRDGEPTSGDNQEGSDNPSLRRFSWQNNPEKQFCWCDLCGGEGLLTCNRCNGDKYVNTAPGGAGVRFFVGTARCSRCQGMGRTPCPLCAGCEDPTRVYFDEDNEEAVEEDASWMEDEYTVFWDSSNKQTR